MYVSIYLRTRAGVVFLSFFILDNFSDILPTYQDNRLLPFPLPLFLFSDSLVSQTTVSFVFRMGSCVHAHGYCGIRKSLFGPGRILSTRASVIKENY